MPVVTTRASESNMNAHNHNHLRRRSKSSLSSARRRVKKAASNDRINDENDGEVVNAGNANKKAKTCGGRRALLEIAWWTVTPNLGQSFSAADEYASNSYILYGGTAPSSRTNDNVASSTTNNTPPKLLNTSTPKKSLPTRPNMSRTTSMR
ncbi:hypothetical protein E3P99_04043 [Wallemia hederae]|uniref:Uncharacterized protein n=1 Tax=Wallemia hederae TaxID=1540922 RepID=A0A4T0FB49_9BASI|nr:hypothetical protein E3P99_04043 [Wallemia hederae]